MSDAWSHLSDAELDAQAFDVATEAHHSDMAHDGGSAELWAQYGEMQAALEERER